MYYIRIKKVNKKAHRRYIA